MSRLIILEGVDSTGKSSLAKFIARRLKAAYMHASGHKSLHDGMYAHHENLLDNAEFCMHNDLDVVIDRHWPSEYAYAGVLRPSFLAKYDFQKMVARIGRWQPTYIYCHSDVGWPRYLETHKDHDTTIYRRLSEGDYHAIITEYKSLFDNDSTIKRYSIEEHGADLVGWCERNGI